MSQCKFSTRFGAGTIYCQRDDEPHSIHRFDFSVSEVEVEHQDAAFATLRARVAALTRVARALDDLMDWQNGPPLVTYTEGWTAAMDEARAALSAAEPSRTEPKESKP